MHWININIDALQSMEFKRSNPTKRATWLSLLGYCCQHETGGRITGCRDWSDREWLQVCGVTKEEVLTDSLLCTFDGDDLLVAFYPLSQEQAIKAKREAGKKGGRPRKIDAPQSPELQAKEPYGLPDGSDSLKRKEKEGKGKEGKGKNTMSDEAPPAEDGEFGLFGEKIETGPTIEEEMERVWKAYPSKTGRKAALPHIKRAVKKHGADWLIEKIQAYKIAYDNMGWSYKMGSTYFNQDSYDDELPTPPPNPQFFADQRKIAAEQSNACG